MSDTVASVVLAVDIFATIVAVKVLIRLIVSLGQLPPRRQTTRLRCAPGSPASPRPR
jgi:hypothetical protein